MIKQLKAFTINLVAGANIATVILMLLAGYSDRFNPADYPMLSCLSLAFPVFLIVNLLFLFFWLTFKWNKVWIPVLGYLLAYLPISLYMPLNFHQEVAAQLSSGSSRRITQDCILQRLPVWRQLQIRARLRYRLQLP